MAVLEWPTIASTDIDAESSVYEDLVGAFHDAHECLITGPIDTQFPERAIVSGVTYASSPNPLCEIFLPAPVETGAGEVELVFRVEMKLQSAGTGAVSFAIHDGGTQTGSNVTVSGITNTTYETFEVRFPDADLKNEVNEGDTTIRIKHDSGPDVDIRCIKQASRLERIE